MGKKKIDKLKLIEDKLQRNVAFCKRKRGFLKKAIELSQLCEQNILIIISNQDKSRVVQYQNNNDFSIKEAYNTVNIAKNENSKSSYEFFTNEDYQKLEVLDFRSIRYKKDVIYNNDIDKISDFDEI